MKALYMGIIVPLSILIPIFIGACNYRLIDKPAKIIWYYLLLDGFTNLIAISLADLHIRNLPVLHVFTMLEFLSLGYFYLNILTGRIAKRIIYVLLIIFPVFCILNFVFLQSINNFNTNTRPVEALIIMACSLSYFASTADVNLSWHKNPLNWINAGILIYFSGALFIFSFSNVTLNESLKYYSLNLLMWNIHATLVLIMYLLIAIGFINARSDR